MHVSRQWKAAAAAAKADNLRLARQVTAVLMLLAVALSFSSVHYLSGIVNSKLAAPESLNVHDWHDVLTRVEHNLESHLPHQLSDELAAIGVGQRPQGK